MSTKVSRGGIRLEAKTDICRHHPTFALAVNSHSTPRILIFRP